MLCMLKIVINQAPEKPVSSSFPSSDSFHFPRLFLPTFKFPNHSTLWPENNSPPIFIILKSYSGVAATRH